MIEKPRFEGSSEVWVAVLAGELLSWLAGRAAEGSKGAQNGLVDLAVKAGDWHHWSLSKGHEGALIHARRNPTIPGRVSLNPEQTADHQLFLESIGQGCETPVPMKKESGASGMSTVLPIGLWRLFSITWKNIEIIR